MKPDFSTMSRKELRAYVLAHRGDEAAFFAYVDRSNQEATWVDCPPVDSVESLQQFPLFLEKLQRESQS
jgi:predicted GNAT family acetyltransferase